MDNKDRGGLCQGKLHFKKRVFKNKNKQNTRQEKKQWYGEYPEDDANIKSEKYSKSECGNRAHFVWRKLQVRKSLCLLKGYWSVSRLMRTDKEDEEMLVKRQTDTMTMYCV